nr:zinc-ribbon domain-containing protein [Candidatus Brocadiales bacterium]
MTSKSNKRKIIIEGREFDSIQSASSAFGLSRNTVDYRLSKGWTPKEAVGLVPRPDHAANTPGIPVKVKGLEFKNIKEAAKYYGRAYTHVFYRLKEGCTIEQALGLVQRTDSLQSEFPEVAKQWHPTKNTSLTADKVTPHSGQRVWWLCPNGHEWKAVINSRTRGNGCPFCAGQKPTADRNFATEYPWLLTEWDFGKNSPKKPEGFTPRSSSKVWWKCKKGHSWKTSISNRTRDTKNLCPCCSNRMLCEDNSNSLAQVRPDIAEDWYPYKNAPLTPNDVVSGGSKKVWWICKHGHEWETTVGLRVIAGTGCPMCSNQTSRIEIAVYSELDALFDDVAWREKFSGYECDIYLRDNNIGVEVDGVYWHSPQPERELEKSAVFESEGIQLFRLREDGLPAISERDISFMSSEDEFLVISRLVSSLLKHAKLSDQQRVKLCHYIKGSGLINETFYRELVANLPAPPPGQSLVDKQPEIAKQWA